MHDEGNSFLMKLTGLHIPGKSAYVYDLIKDQKDLKPDSVSLQETGSNLRKSIIKFYQNLTVYNHDTVELILLF